MRIHIRNTTEEVFICTLCMLLQRIRFILFMNEMQYKWIFICRYSLYYIAKSTVFPYLSHNNKKNQLTLSLKKKGDWFYHLLAFSYMGNKIFELFILFRVLNMKERNVQCSVYVGWASSALGKLWNRHYQMSVKISGMAAIYFKVYAVWTLWFAKKNL